FIRGKRTKSQASSSTLRAVTQMSVLSANRKQPKVLKLSKEDIVRHITVDSAWKLYQQKKKELLRKNLKDRYDSILDAANDLKSLYPKLYESSITNVNKTKSKSPNRFPIELRVPTDFPPNQIWNYEY
ncbi:mitochondrial 54S ribosomal protein mL40 ASCRUDRAFT_21318, partial [Ascoidea rubescens DSM 1968]